MRYIPYMNARGFRSLTVTLLLLGTGIAIVAAAVGRQDALTRTPKAATGALLADTSVR